MGSSKIRGIMCCSPHPIKMQIEAKVFEKMMPGSLIRLETTFKLGIQLKYLKYINLKRFTSLALLDIQHCKQLREIPRLPHSVECVNASKSYSLNPQLLSTLLNQVGEILGILPNKALLGIIVVALIWINGLSTMEEILDIHVDGEEETIDQPMPDVAKNTTCPTSDGFESDSDSGKGALVQPFQLQRACPGLWGKWKR
nr:hypothetical protein CFP56_48523 [Quercus suber]